MSIGPQEFRPSVLLSPGTLAWSWLESGEAGTLTSAHMGYQHCSWQLYSLYPNADSVSICFNQEAPKSNLDYSLNDLLSVILYARVLCPILAAVA